MKSQLEIILASGSPRRKQLLKQLGISFRVVRPRFDEEKVLHPNPRQLVIQIAEGKAIEVESRTKIKSKRQLILAADTIVVDPSGKKVLGKPKDKADAKRMLQMLSGETHTVLTGYVVIDRTQTHRRCIRRAVRSRVRIRPLNSQQIQRYISTGDPMDKAGSYGAQDLGAALVEEIRGSYTNVVGLPVVQLQRDLEEKLGISLFIE